MGACWDCLLPVYPYSSEFLFLNSLFSDSLAIFNVVLFDHSFLCILYRFIVYTPLFSWEFRKSTFYHIGLQILARICLFWLVDLQPTINILRIHFEGKNYHRNAGDILHGFTRAPLYLINSVSLFEKNYYWQCKRSDI